MNPSPDSHATNDEISTHHLLQNQLSELAQALTMLQTQIANSPEWDQLFTEEHKMLLHGTKAELSRLLNQLDRDQTVSEQNLSQIHPLLENCHQLLHQYQHDTKELRSNLQQQASQPYTKSNHLPAP
jgi:hypothetical protein